jgi:hypothetical protein
MIDGKEKQGTAIARYIAAVFLAGMSTQASAIPREDVLECTTPGQGTFILRSKYEFDITPLPTYHHSRVSKRGRWHISFRNSKGRLSEVPGGIDYNGVARWALDLACAHVGVIHGRAVAPFTFMRDNDAWSSIDDFPWPALDVNLLTVENPSPEQKILLQAGVKGTAFHFGLVVPLDGVLLYEKPLYYDKKAPTFNTVLQSKSLDDGETWSVPTVTEEASLFEIGKGWTEQRFVARPVSLNGKPLR